MLRLEVRNAAVPIEKKPSWIKTTARMGPEYRDLQALVKSEGLHTVCQEAGCPNIFECWEDREATFLIGGDQCTRRCDFCQIDTGKPADLDTGEPLRVAESVQKMGLHYATITGVCRDDLPDEGAWLYAETIRKVKELNPGTGVEMLAPDFSSNTDYLDQLFAAGPAVFAHNVETVPRIFKRIRPGFRYDRSLGVLRYSRAAGMVTKSNLILGMGETREEVSEALRDLHDAGTEIITITQYLRPSPRHHPVDRWVKPEEFVELAAEAQEIGFAGVLSGPLVRSSYRAGRLYREALASREDLRPGGGAPLMADRKTTPTRTGSTAVPRRRRPTAERQGGQGRGQAVARRRPSSAARTRPTRRTWAGSARSRRPTRSPTSSTRSCRWSCCGAFLLPVVLGVVVGLLVGPRHLRRRDGRAARRAAGHGAAGPPGQAGDVQALRRPDRLRRGRPVDAAQAVGLHPGHRGDPAARRRAPHPRPRRAGADRRGRGRPGPPAAEPARRASTSGSRTASPSRPSSWATPPTRSRWTSSPTASASCPRSSSPTRSPTSRQRLRALDAVRPVIGMPKGPMPTTRASRQATRGR